MKREKCRWIRLIPFVLVLVLLLPLSPLSVVERVEAVTQADIDKLKKESASLASQRKEVQSKLAKAREEKSELTSQKSLLEDDIDLIQQSIASIQERITGIQGQIESIQSKINSLQGQISDLDVEIEDYIAQIDAKQKELEEAEAEEARLYELFCQRVRLMEEQGQVSYWSILFSSDSFSDLLDNILMVQEFMDYDNAIMEDLQELQETIRTQKADLEEIRTQLEQSRSELQAAKEEQEAAKREQEAAKQEQEAAKQEQLSAQQDLRTQEAEVQKLIDNISVTEQQLQAEESALKKAAASADAKIKQMEKELAPKISSVKAEGSFAWPLPGKTALSSLFGGRIHPITGKPNNHTGIDIPAAYGTSIKCAKSGVVTISMRGPSYGNYVVVSHSDGTSTLYAHMSSRSVSVGQSVNQGQELGKVGSTGSSTGNHLHFEIRVNGSRVDPVNYFSGLSVRSGGKTVRLN